MIRIKVLLILLLLITSSLSAGIPGKYVIDTNFMQSNMFFNELTFSLGESLGEKRALRGSQNSINIGRDRLFCGSLYLTGHHFCCSPVRSLLV